MLLQRIKLNYKFLELSKKEGEEFFHDKPLIVLGAGPSLQTNLKWLQQHQDEFIIVAAFAALKTLYKVNISPDIVIQIDEKVTETVTLIQSFESLEFLEKSLFILSASVPQILLDVFHKEQIYFVEDRTAYRLANTRLVTSSVGEFAYTIALLFNPKSIYLLGLDFALSKEGGTHAQDHHRATSLDTSKEEEIKTTVSLEKTIVHVKGNFIDEVASTPLLAFSIPKMNNFTKLYKSVHQEVFNLSDNGAYFENTYPLELSQYTKKQPINKKELTKQLTDIFDKYALEELDAQELDALHHKQKQIQEYHTLIEQFSTSALSSRDIFLQNYSLLIQNILNTQESELREILTIYFLAIAPYIFDMFNTKELDNLKKHTKKMKKIIVRELYRVIELYEIEIEKTF